MPKTQFPWQIKKGESLSYWEVSGLTETPFAGEADTLPDKVNYTYINGFTDVGDLPCRIAFWNDMKGRDVTCPHDAQMAETRIQPSQSVLDFSGFWFCPTHLQRVLRCVVNAPTTRNYQFRVHTAGGVRVWVNGEPGFAFEPLVRNKPQESLETLALSEGANEIVVHLEDIAERDTVYSLELLYEGSEETDADLQVGLSATYDAEALREAEAFISSVQPDKLYYSEGHVELQFEGSLPEDAQVHVETLPLLKPTLAGSMGTYTLPKGANRLVGPRVDDLAPATNLVRVTLFTQGLGVAREVGVVCLKDLEKGTGSTLEERRNELLTSSAQTGESHLSHALAKLHAGTDLDTAEKLLLEALSKISRREDCADFAFLPLLWIWKDHAWTKFSEQTWRRVRSTILGFRYWFDEPGNDAMWFWSENHTLCFHASQYLAGIMFPEDLFLCSGRQGQHQKQVGYERLLKWFETVERDGLAEWNSIPYYPIDFIGLTALYHLAQDADIRDRSKALMDSIFQMMALHTQSGLPAGTMGRCYDKDIFAGPASELATLCHFAWGNGFVSSGNFASTLVALSDYAPPEETSTYASVPEGRALETSYTQGHEHAGKLKLCKTADAQLSTVVDHKTGQHGHQQHVQDVMLAGNPYARFWINHPGETQVWGSGRPSYWSGNGTLPRADQTGPVGLMIFNAAENETDFTHLYGPLHICDEHELTGNWLFARVKDGFTAFYTANGMEPLQTGCFAGVEFRSSGRRNAWVTVTGSAQIETFAEFKARLLTSSISWNLETLSLSVEFNGQGNLSLNWEGELRVNGKQSVFENLSPVPRIGLKRLDQSSLTQEEAHV
ncbi:MULTISPECIES: hypothetical protein [unclassified Pseudovibrio]|uniref:hypothetical protein n=1 Tax=unclassified Pseudovibrio TaxID=2627060 RepID=UPI0007AEA924|nr:MULTISPECIES: hypothetical protein [unclassified Pseudovibrio]KZL02429.1 hypothetical protein PsW74_01531 [Pseudovibrio sp. W74]KZL08027.1 hypothetical protein PsAD14_03170 [Pseudovibrio sp. Ad14]